MDFTQESDNQNIHSMRKKVYDINSNTSLYISVTGGKKKKKGRERKRAVCQSVRVMYRGSPNHYTDSGLNRPRK